jgi:hypothetical protein
MIDLSRPPLKTPSETALTEQSSKPSRGRMQGGTSDRFWVPSNVETSAFGAAYSKKIVTGGNADPGRYQPLQNAPLPDINPLRSRIILFSTQ